jgi:hypothetical protein
MTKKSDNDQIVETIEINEENIRKSFEILGVPYGDPIEKSVKPEDEETPGDEDKETSEEQDKEDEEGTEKHGKKKKGKEDEEVEKAFDPEKVFGKKKDKDNDKDDKKVNPEDVGVKGEDDKDEEKGEKKKPGEKEEEDEDDEKEEKGDKKKKKPEEEDEDDKDDDKDDEKVEKSLDSGSGSSAILKGIEGMFEKQTTTMDQKFRALGILEKAIKIEQMEIQKSLDRQEAQQEQFDDKLESFQERLEKLERQPGIRKSFTSQNFVEREFDDKDDIEKGGVKVVDINNRGQVLDILKSKAGFDSNSPDESFMNALLLFESAGQIHKSTRERLLKEDKIFIK